MATVTALDFGDLVASTLYDLGPPRFSQIATSYQDYEVFSKWFKKDKVVFDSGIGIQRTLMTRLSGAASHVGLMDEDSVNIPDLLETIQIPWRHAQTSWAVIYQENLMNRGRALIQKVIKPRRAAAILDLVEELEDKAWATPPSSSDKTLPYGIRYWIVQDDTTGFNGEYPTGHTTLAGLDLDDAANFKNYTAQYTTVSKADLVKKLRTAHRKIRFKSPINIKEYRSGKGERYRLYTDEATISSLEDLGEAQNENLGRDVASMDGTMTFRNHPIVWVPKLEDVSNAPVYMVDHATFYPVVLRGDYLRESAANRAPNQHNIFQYFVDLTYNFLCVDRRRNAVLTTGAT